jgi:hypothetical protein
MEKVLKADIRASGELKLEEMNEINSLITQTETG